MASFACPLAPSYKASIHLDGTAHIVLAFASWPRHDAILDVEFALGAGLESVAVVGEGATVLRTRFDRGAQVVTFELRGVNAASSGVGGGHHFTFIGRPIEGGTALLRPPEQISCPSLAPLPPPPRPPPSAPPPPAPPPHACVLDVRYTLTRQLSAALGVRYERVAASLDGKCSREQWLKCNVTAPIPGVVAAVRSAAAEVARGS